MCCTTAADDAARGAPDSDGEHARHRLRVLGGHHGISRSGLRACPTPSAAKMFITQAIEAALPLGRGHGPANPMHGAGAVDT